MSEEKTNIVEETITDEVPVEEKSAETTSEVAETEEKPSESVKEKVDVIDKASEISGSVGTGKQVFSGMCKLCNARIASGEVKDGKVHCMTCKGDF